MLNQDSEMGNQLEKWFEDSVKPLGNLDLVDTQEINIAGAKPYRDELRKVTKSTHYSNHHDKVYGHMADNIDMSFGTEGKAGDYGTAFGGVYVGWNNHYHAMNAMRLNDGTKSRPADHFKTNLDNDQNVIDEVLNAEKKAYKGVMKRKKVDLDNQ